MVFETLVLAPARPGSFIRDIEEAAELLAQPGGLPFQYSIAAPVAGGRGEKRIARVDFFVIHHVSAKY